MEGSQSEQLPRSSASVPFRNEVRVRRFAGELLGGQRGSVVLHAKGGGVHQAWALVEADEQGFAGLKQAGFEVGTATKGRYVDSSGARYVVRDDGGPVSREFET